MCTVLCVSSVGRAQVITGILVLRGVYVCSCLLRMSTDSCYSSKLIQYISPVLT